MSKIRVIFIAILILIIFPTSLMVANAESDIAKIEIKIQVEDKTFLFCGDDIEYAKDINKELASKGKFDAKHRFKGLKKPIEYSFRLKEIDEKLEKIGNEFLVQPIDAEILFDKKNPKNSTVKSEILGQRLPVEKLKKEIESNLKKGLGVNISCKIEPYAPLITEKKLKAALNRCIVFSTDIQNSSYERKHNIALALSKFDGKMILPNEEVSFNETVGKRTAQNGFLEANVIINGIFEKGVGGGVCQASTTLYNAILLADMKATKVKNHSLPIGYVPASFDAMVSSANDFRFKNTTDCIMFLRTYCTDEKAYVEVWRQKMPYSIERKSEILSETEIPKEEILIDRKGKYADRLKDCDSFWLQSSKAGIQSAGYLVYSKNGRIIRQTKIRTDKYKAQVGILVKKEEKTIDN